MDIPHSASPDFFSKARKSVTKTLPCYLLISLLLAGYSSAVAAFNFYVPSSDSDGTFTITWNGGAGIKVVLFEKLDGSSTWNGIHHVDGSSGASGSVTLSKPTGHHEYKFMHCYRTGYSVQCPHTAPKSILITEPRPPTPGNVYFQNINSGGDSNGSFRVRWGSASGTTRYEWQEKKNSNAWSGPYNAGTNLYVDRSGRSNGVWYYRVRACNSAGCSSYTSARSVKVAIAPGRPPGISASPQSDGTIEVDWSAASGSVSHYVPQYRVDNGSYKSIDGNFSGSTTAATLPDSVRATYTFRVKACKSVSGFTSCSSWRYSASTTQSVGNYNYRYDELGRLIRVVDVKNRETEYDYDDADNRLEKTVEQLPQ